MSSGEIKRPYSPAEILQDAAQYLSSSKDKPPHMKPLVKGFADNVSAMMENEIVDLSVQFNDDDGNPREPQHVGTVQFGIWTHDDARNRWLGRFKSINTPDFNEWPTEGTEIPLGAECLVFSDVSSNK